jgi:hypothetical protein
MLNCKQVSKVIASDDLVGAGLGKRLSVWLHLLMCKYCRAYTRQMRAVGDATREKYAGRPTAEEAARLESMKEAVLSDDRNKRSP